MKQLNPKVVWLFFFSFLPRFIILFIFLGMFGGPVIMFGLLAKMGFSNQVPMATTIEVSPFALFGGLGGVFLIFIFLILVGSYVWARLSYKYYKYELADLGFRKESGVLYKKYVTIPYDRIQNVDINRGILARMLGLSDLQIQTAGSSAVMSRYGAVGVGAEGRLPGLSQADAEQLRDELIRRAHRPTTQGL